MFETSQQEAFCDNSKALKSAYGRGSAPDPAGGSWRATDPLVGWGGKPHLSPFLFPPLRRYISNDKI